MSDDQTFLYAAEYESVEDAKADLELLKDLHQEHLVGTYDAAVLTKNEEGKVEIVDKDREANPARRLGGVSGRRGHRPDLPSLHPGQRASGSRRRSTHRPPPRRYV